MRLLHKTPGSVGPVTYPFMAQAEALPPEIRDRLVAEAIDALHDIGTRDDVIAAEAALHANARTELARLLAEGS